MTRRRAHDAARGSTNRVKGNTAIITGAAHGIGRACAKLLAEEGAVVYLTDRDDDAGEESAAGIREAGGDASFLHQDVSHEADWERVVSLVRAARRHIDILVNNAGLYVIASLEESTLDCMRRIFETNVYGVFLGMKHVAPVMAERGGGSIINISSMDAVVGAERLSIYGGSKGAVLTMTRDVAIEYAKRGVRVNSVHPGYIRTRMATYGAKQEDTTVGELGEDFPMGRIGEPIDVAWGVLYLASEESRWVTGTQLRIDGGATAE
jgi:NAD(P)-dependent dehydrogenase (short-subunit alcohol dehydrogenase family)